MSCRNCEQGGHPSFCGEECEQVYLRAYIGGSDKWEKAIELKKHAQNDDTLGDILRERVAAARTARALERIADMLEKREERQEDEMRDVFDKLSEMLIARKETEAAKEHAQTAFDAWDLPEVRLLRTTLREVADYIDMHLVEATGEARARLEDLDHLISGAKETT